MKAIIIGAGRGIRLIPETKSYFSNCVTIQFSPGGDKAPLKSILRRVEIIG